MKAAVRDRGGFTIVETIIVLAIAGLILMIVLLAIPTLQRNSRNSQRRQDVQNVLQAISNYKLNHSGSMPVPTSNFLQYTRLTSYDTTVGYIVNGVGSPTASGINIYAEQATANPVPGESNTNLNTVNVYDYRKCNPASPGTSTNHGAGFGDVVALYAIETSNGSASQCQQL